MQLTSYDSMEYIEFYTETVSLSKQIDSSIKHIQKLKESNYKLYGEASIFKALISAISKAIKYIGRIFKNFISKITGGKLFGGGGSSGSSGVVVTKSLDLMKGIYKTINSVSSSEIESGKKDIRTEIQRTLRNKADEEKLSNLAGGLSDVSEQQLEDIIIKISKKLNEKEVSKINESIDYIETTEKSDQEGILKSEFKSFFPQNIKANLDDDIIDALNIVYKNNRNKFLNNVDGVAELIFKNGNIPDEKFKEYYSTSNALQFLYLEEFDMGGKTIKFADHMEKSLNFLISSIKESEKMIKDGGSNLKEELTEASNNKKLVMKSMVDMFPKYAGNKIERRKNMMLQGKNVDPLPQPKPNDPTTYTGYIKGTRLENPQTIFNNGDNFKNFIKFQNIFRVNAPMYQLLQYVYNSFNNGGQDSKKLIDAATKVVDGTEKLSDTLDQVDQENLNDNVLSDIKDLIGAYRIFGEYVIAMDMVTKNQLVNAVNLKDIYLQIRYQLILLMIFDSVKKYKKD